MATLAKHAATLPNTTLRASLRLTPSSAPSPLHRPGALAHSSTWHLKSSTSRVATASRRTGGASAMLEPSWHCPGAFSDLYSLWNIRRWSLGVLLYECFHACSPWCFSDPDADDRTIITRIRNPSFELEFVPLIAQVKPITDCIKVSRPHEQCSPWLVWPSLAFSELPRPSRRDCLSTRRSCASTANGCASRSSSPASTGSPSSRAGCPRPSR